jgi:hypothetical protein
MITGKNRATRSSPYAFGSPHFRSEDRVIRQFFGIAAAATADVFPRITARVRDRDSGLVVAGVALLGPASSHDLTRQAQFRPRPPARSLGR